MHGRPVKAPWEIESAMGSTCLVTTNSANDLCPAMFGQSGGAFAPVDRAHGDNGFGQRIDPYGWQAPKHIDPWAWMYLGDIDDGWDIYRDAGAFSIELWDTNAAPPAANW